MVTPAEVEVSKLPAPESVPTNNTTKYVHSPEALHPPARKNPVNFVHTSDGREATLRVLQYTLRLVVYLKTFSSKRLSRLLAAVSILSAVRRIVALYDISLFLYETCAPSKLSLNPFKTPPSRRPRLRLTIDDLLRLSRATLDVASILADNVYLIASLGVLPPRVFGSFSISSKTARRADRIADLATLVSALLGLTQCAHSRAQIWDEGRALRKNALALEARLDDLEFWGQGEMVTTSSTLSAASDLSRTSRATAVEGRAGDELFTGAGADISKKELEERRLRDKIRTERRRLKRLREELNELWWERLRLGAEAVFAAWDVLELDVGSEAIKSLSGFSSASIMLSQAWREYIPRRGV